MVRNAWIDSIRNCVRAFLVWVLVRANAPRDDRRLVLAGSMRQFRNWIVPFASGWQAAFQDSRGGPWRMSSARTWNWKSSHLHRVRWNVTGHGHTWSWKSINGSHHSRWEHSASHGWFRAPSASNWQWRTATRHCECRSGAGHPWRPWASEVVHRFHAGGPVPHKHWGNEHHASSWVDGLAEHRWQWGSPAAHRWQSWSTRRHWSEKSWARFSSWRSNASAAHHRTQWARAEVSD